MVSDNIAPHGDARDRNIPARGGTALSIREREIVALAARGATDKEIADDLDLSVATLRTYWMRVREKLGAVNRTHAIALCAHDGATPKVVDTHARLVESLARDRVAIWVWQGRARQVVLDAHAERLFDLPASDRPIGVDRLLAHVWTPDRARFERFLSQGCDLRAMTPIEMRVGTPGDYRTLVRTVNLTGLGPPESTLLLSSTAIHTFA